MTDAFIDIKRAASETAAEAATAIDQLQASKDKFEKLKATFEQMALGADWVGLAGYLGTTADEAEAVYNLWLGAVAELQATNITQLLSRCG